MKPYRVSIAKPGHDASHRDFATQVEALAAFCRSVIALRKFDADITVTYRPPVEKGMFGIPMPDQTVATCTLRRNYRADTVSERTVVAP